MSLSKLVSPDHVKDLVAASFSANYNPRNLENDIYSGYHDTQYELVRGLVTPAGGTMSVRQQYDLWLTKEAVNPLKLPKDQGEAAYPDGLSDSDEAPSDAPRRSSRLKSNEDRRAATVKKRLDDYKKNFGKQQEVAPEGGALHPDAAGVLGTTSHSDDNGVEEQGDGGAEELEASQHIHVGLEEFYDDVEEERARNAEHVNDEEPEGEVMALGDDENPAADVSMLSHVTAPNSGGKDNFPDMVLCHTCTRELEAPEDPDALFAHNARHGRKVVHQCFPAITELKRSVSRCLRGEAFEEERARLLELAETELIYYIAVQFHRDPQASSVIAISGTGMWWRWTQFSRAETVPLRYWTEKPILSEKETQDYFKGITQMHAKFDSAPLNYLGRTESDAEWNKLRKKALIPILEAHANDYPTSMPPPRPASKSAKDSSGSGSKSTQKSTKQQQRQ